jgi:hypothetical protein
MSLLVYFSLANTSILAYYLWSRLQCHFTVQHFGYFGHAIKYKTRVEVLLVTSMLAYLAKMEIFLRNP